MNTGWEKLKKVVGVARRVRAHLKPAPCYNPFATTCTAPSRLIPTPPLSHFDEALLWWSLFIWIRWPTDLFPDCQDTDHPSCLPSCLEREKTHFCLQNVTYVSLHQTRVSADAGAATTFSPVCFYCSGGEGAFPVTGNLTRTEQSLLTNSARSTCVGENGSKLLYFVILKVWSICLLLQVPRLDLRWCPSPGLHYRVRVESHMSTLSVSKKLQEDAGYRSF